MQQDPFAAVSPRLTIAEIVAEPLMVDGASAGASETLARVRDVLAQLRLPTDDEFLARRAHQVSGGELQRITIARALLADPRVLLLDEPASMLDPSEQAELLRLVKDAQVRHGTAIVLVSHDLAVLGRLADRLLVLAGGRVVEAGTADAVLGAPTTDLVRALVAATRGEHAYPTTGAPGATDPEESPWNSTAAPC